MARRHYNLPPLTTLACFEAAARHLSFKDAAQELGVTPGAVSHQIKALEGDLGIVLFERKHRGVELTEGGVRLFSTLQRSFSDISGTLSRLRRSTEDHSVTIAATTAVSSLWLTPRLTRFWKEHGHVQVNQLVADGPARPDQPADLTIKYGASSEPNLMQTRLFRDHLVPLCSPAFAATHPESDIDALAQMPLIHLQADDRSWTTWQTWFQELGYDGEIACALRVNNYTIALQAARDDVGVVLGWRRLVGPLLQRQVLVPLTDKSLRAPLAFHIISRDDDNLTANERLVRQWLLDKV